MRYPSMIYLVGAPDVGPGRVKIGTTSQPPASRLANLQTGSPVTLKLIYHWPGSPQMEHQLHRVFSRYRLHGEWFEFGRRSPVKAVNDALRSTEVASAAPPWLAWAGSQQALMHRVSSVHLANPEVPPADLAKQLGLPLAWLTELLEKPERERMRLSDIGVATAPRGMRNPFLEPSL